MAVYDLCVVGAGMIGSAAARHASRDPAVKVCLVGPSEPTTKSLEKPRDIFGSHYDEGRITRSCDADPVWAALAQESRKRYRDIEKQSGVTFYNEVGLLWIGSKQPATEISDMRRNAHDQGIPITELSHQDLTEQYPYLKLADDDAGWYEKEHAGHISPRKLVEAQKIISRKQGCTIIDDVGQSVERVVQQDGSYVMRVITEGGSQIMSKAVVLATGAFTNFRRLLPGVKPEQRLYGQTVALAEVDSAYAEKLRCMPTVFYEGRGHPEFYRFPRGTATPAKFYMLPPIQYPDGRHYIKLGFTSSSLSVALTSGPEVKQWFVNGNSNDHAENTAKFISSLFRGLELKSWHGDFCVVMKTSSNRPYIDKIHAQLGVAVGGNGYAAKSSDEIGRLAADMMIGRWDSDIPRDVFKLRLEKEAV